MLGMGWASGPLEKVVIAKLYRQAALDDHINTFNGSFLQMKMKEGPLEMVILLSCQLRIAREKLLIVSNDILIQRRRRRKRRGVLRKFSLLISISRGYSACFI